MSEILRSLSDGFRSDATRPTGTVYFVTSANVRSKARQWQFASAAQALNELGVEAIVSTNRPHKRAGILGIQMGASNPNPGPCGVHRPGSMAEHLTSFAAAFEGKGQTEISKWIRAGATASAGTVAEPYAIWTKFPSAFFYVHYAHGLTLLESFALSLGCPLQTLLLGEPLAAPWAEPIPTTLLNLAEEPTTGAATFMVRAWKPPPPGEIYTVTFLLDGVPVSGNAGQPMIEVDTSALADGFHEMRAVVETSGRIRKWGRASTSFVVANHTRTVTLTSAGTSGSGSNRTVEVTATGEPRALRVEASGSLWEQDEVQESTSFTISADKVGYGPVRIQALAEYEDGMVVRSTPLELLFKRP